MRTLALCILAATLSGCGSVSDRSGGSSSPTNPFASNYPSVEPGARRAPADDRAGRRGNAAFRPPAEVPY